MHPFLPICGPKPPRHSAWLRPHRREGGGEGCRGEIPPGTDLQRRNLTAQARTITVICIQSYTFLLIIVLVNYKNILFIYIRIIYTCIISINRPLSSFFLTKVKSLKPLTFITHKPQPSRVYLSVIKFCTYETLVYMMYMNNFFIH